MRRRSASTIRARRWSPGMARAASPWAMPSSGRTPAAWPLIEKLKAEGAETLTIERAGLPLDPYFSASKLRWIIDELPEAKRAAGARPAAARHQRQLLPRPPGGSLCHRRHHGLAHQPDESRAPASGTPSSAASSAFPWRSWRRSAPTVGDFGSVGKLPLRASLVDQQAALFGHGCRQPGQAKITFGTGAFALCVAAPRRGPGGGRRHEPQRRLAPRGRRPWSMRSRAASTTPPRRSTGRAVSVSSRIRRDRRASPAPRPSSAGLVFVPALSGSRVPYWDRNAAGLWLGMGLETTRADMMQALLEGIALLAAELIAAMDRASPLTGAVSIDGGLSNNRLFLRFPGRGAAAPGAGAGQRRSDRAGHGADGADRRRAGDAGEPAAGPGAPPPCHARRRRWIQPRAPASPRPSPAAATGGDAGSLLRACRNHRLSNSRFDHGQ